MSKTNILSDTTMSFTENILVIEMKKTGITMNKLVYLRLSIEGSSKIIVIEL